MTNVETSRPNECRVRVLVVENDRRTAALHKKNLIRWGYEAFVAEGVGNELINDAQRMAYEHACHIALVDMRLIDDYDKSDKSGLDLVAKLKPAISIIVSGSGDDRKTALEAVDKGAVDFVGKEDPLTRLRNSLQQAATKVFVCGTQLQLHIHENLPQQIMDALAPGKPSQVYEIFCALFPNATNIIVKPIGSEARTPKNSTRQHSFVFRVNVDGLQPVVVKIASVERIKREFAKYKKYIENRVNGNFYAQVQNTALRWQIGAIVYSFIGAEQSHFRLFRDYYRAATISKLKKVIHHLFVTTWGTVYKQTRESKVQSLLEVYTNVWGREWLQRLENHADVMPEIMVAVPDELKLLNPLQWLIHRSVHGKHDESLLPHSYIAVGHGDMLGDNFFVDQHEQAWTIDYERTGVGPILQDFVLLEIDVLVRLIRIEHGEDFEFFRLAVQLLEKWIPSHKLKNLDHTDSKKAHAVIRAIRQAADSLIDYEKERHYLWGLLLNIVFRLILLKEKLAGLLKFTTSHSSLEPQNLIVQLRLEQQRALLVGSLICHRLDNWDKPWPPESWEEFMTEIVDDEKEANSNIFKPIKILFIAANPFDTTRLRIDEEQHRIDQELRKGELRDRFHLVTHVATRVEDLQELLQRHKPTIVHFSSHGTYDGEIVLQDSTGNAKPVPPNALSNLFRILKDNVRCVVLNACYSQTQACGIAEQVDTVVGMTSSLDDDAAIQFSAGFYLALGYGRDIQTAFDLGANAIELSGGKQGEILQLMANHADPSTIFLHNPT